MKKFSILIVALTITMGAFSQKVSGGLFFGPNLSWYTLDTKIAENQGVKFGYMFGAMLDFNLVENFALTTGINFNSLGGSQKYQYGAHNFNRQDFGDTTLLANSVVKFKMDYLEIPIGFKGKTNEIGYFTYFLKGGVTPGINIKARADITVGSNDIISEESKLLNLGWYLGGGFTFSLAGNTRLLTEVVYTGGIFDTDRIDVVKADATSANVKSKLNSIALKVGILF